MRIRKYMVVGVLSIIVFPWFVYFFVHFIHTHSWQPWTQTQSQNDQAQLTQTVLTITRNVKNWTNPTWQRSLQNELTHHGIDAVIQSPSNQVIFDSTQSNRRHWIWNQQVMVVQDGRLLGTIQVYSPGGGDAVAAIAALVALVFAISFVGFQIRRNVIRPLEAMSHAALQIAEGDFDSDLPASSVVEIKQVRTAFDVMVTGLREAFSKQAKLEEERRFFIGAIAHDLRTPLFSLRGYLDGLEQGIAVSADKIADYVAVCKEKATHLDRLVADLFAFTRLEYMEQTLYMEPLDFTDVVEKAAESLRPLAMDKRIHLHVNVPQHQCLVNGDAHLLERALTNLLDNALRYTPKDGTIIVQLLQEQTQSTLSVQDTGPGFSPDELKHIFEPMYRGDASRNQATGGFGLGLTIAKRIFKSHGGDLIAENHKNGGAVLTGWIPTV